MLKYELASGPRAAPPELQRLGIIDLGSNTMRLVIFAYVPGQCFRIDDVVRERARLSEGADDSGALRAEPMRRAIEVLDLFHRHCNVNNVRDVICAATAATRDAANRDSFLARIRAKTGLEPRLLSGEEEAYYGYLAAANSLIITDGLVVDIGGGSAELTQVVDRRMGQAVSLPLGAVRLTERFLKSDPVKKSEVKALIDHVTEQLSNLDWLGGASLVGMGGTARALAKMDRESRASSFDRLHGHLLARTTVDRIVDQLKELPINRRSTLPGLSNDRADVILGGALVLQAIMDQGHHAACTVSNQGIREGLFYERFLGGDPARTAALDFSAPPLIPDIREFGVQNLVALYDGNIPHFAHVRHLALQLFDQTSSLHDFGVFERDLLSAAAWLHDVGVVVEYWEHHLHSAYIILNSPLPGWTHRETALIALLARNHRKGGLSLNGLGAVLEPTDEARLEKLAALLRLAEYLERGKSGVVRDVRVHLGSTLVQIEALATGDASVEVWEANRNSDLFRKAFGVEVEIVLGIAE